jgi:hypothetical protein
MVGEEEYDLDIERPENNVNGIMVVKGSEIIVGGKEVVDALTIYKPLYDVRDYKAKKVKASLLADGTGITVTEPTVPFYFIQNAGQIYDLEGAKACESTARTHAIAATGIKTNNNRQIKQVTLKFPDGITCNNDNFNKSTTKDGSLKLKNNLRMMPVQMDKDDKGDPITTTIAFVFWKVSIDGEARHLNADAASDSDEDLDDAFKRMQNMKIS